MYVGKLGLVYCGVRDGTVAPGGFGHDIVLTTLIWRNRPDFLWQWIRYIASGLWRWMYVY